MKKSNYKVTLVTNAVPYKGSGATLLEAIDSMGLTYLNVKTKGEITVEKDGKKAVRLFQLGELRRMFASKLRKHGIIRDLERLLV